VTERASAIVRRLQQMQAERLVHESTWRDCYHYTYPERMRGLAGDQLEDAASIQRRRGEVLDSTATDGVRLLSSAVVSGMTPANAVWFALDVGDETDDERRWLDDTSRTIWEAIHASNYDAHKFDAVTDSVCAGWCVLYIDEDMGRLQFDRWPISQCFGAASKPGGRIDILYRLYSMTAEQAFLEYGDKASDRIKADARDKPTTKHQIVHAIYPRSIMGDVGLSGSLPYESVHVEVATKQELRSGGYHEQPFVVPRWSPLPGSVYATGPVSQALPTIRELNALLALEKSALARAAAGVYVAEDDGVLNPRTVTVRGGSIIVANSVDSIKPLPSGADFQVTFAKADEMRREIRRLLMADQLQPQDGPAMTATEVHVRVALIRQLLGPLFGRFQAEDLAPTIERCFGLLFRYGRPEIGGEPGDVLIDDPPDSLAGEVFRIRYQSPLARAQQLDDVTAIERVLMMAGAMAQVGKTDALDLIDSDEALRIAGDGLGAPSKVLRDERAVAALREARREQQEAQAQQAQAQQMQTMAADAAFKRAAAQ
jgi:hypothetical protein